jgi:hypothetical protein
MDTYKIKQLIPGGRVDVKFRDKTLVAVPTKSISAARPLFVAHGYDTMVIRPQQEALTMLSFPNKFGPGTYTLAYYEWKPEKLEFGNSYGEKKEENKTQAL